MSVKTSGLTKGEKLLIQRRRDGHTVAKAAKSRKATIGQYRAWERDEGEGAPNVAVGRLTEFETCFLHRRRKGWTLATLATKMKVCRWWVHQMENGAAPVEALKTFWAKQKSAA